MNILLIDDNASNLARLAKELCDDHRRSLINLSLITLVWPTDGTQSMPELLTTVSNSSLVLNVVRMPDSKSDLGAIIKAFGDSVKSEPATIISDLGMPSIGLGAGDQEGNWLDATGEVRTAIKQFLSNAGNRVLLHSGQGLSAEKIAGQIDPSGVQALPIGQGFDAGGEPESRIADEIVRLLASTPLERAWKNPAIKDWFGGMQAIKHSFSDSECADFWNEVCKVIGDVVPQAAYTDSFHESLKALAGTCFAGSLDQGNIRYPLRLGSVALIASIALHSATSAGDAIRQDLDLVAFWKHMPKALAERSFLKNEDSTTNRQTAVGLYWAFYNLFDKSHGEALRGIEVMKDGFRLNFGWQTKPLFDSLMKKYPTARHQAQAPEISDDYPRPENTTAAFLNVQRWLGFSPGCIVQLSSEYSIDIISPSSMGLSTIPEVT